MGDGFVVPRDGRHNIEWVDGVEQIRLPMRRNWFVLLFLCVWLTGWTVGGFAAVVALVQTHEPFLALWLCGWALGWVFAASTIVTQIWGAEIIRASPMGVEVSKGGGPFRRTWRYRADAIRHLRSFEPASDLFGMRSMQTPIWIRNKVGAVKFDYGADTIFLAAGVDEPEGRQIAQWLAARLPVGATDVQA